MIFLINLIKKNLVVSIFLLIGIILTIILMVSRTFNKELILSKTSPLPGQTETINQSIPVVFYFSEAIDPKTIDIKISPEVKFVSKTDIFEGFGTISINPLPWWEYGTIYTVTIDKKLTGKQGGRTTKDIAFSFSILFPNNNPILFQQSGPGPNN